jgi:hypothetical protein
MAKDDKVKFTISSDGTSKGTKVTLNGDNILEKSCVAMCTFEAQSAASYPTFDGDMRQNPETITFSYLSIDKNDKGEKVFTKYKFCLNEDKWEPVITPLGQAAPEGDGGYAEDNLLGRDSKLVSDILEYQGKVKRYIPARSDLLKRTQESLKDMLEDLKKEV